MNATLPLPTPMFEARLAHQADRRRTAAVMATMDDLARRQELNRRLLQSGLLLCLLVLPYLFLPG